LLFLHCKTCAIVIGLLKATYLLTYLLDLRRNAALFAVIQHRRSSVR